MFKTSFLCFCSVSDAIDKLNQTVETVFATFPNTLPQGLLSSHFVRSAVYLPPNWARNTGSQNSWKSEPRFPPTETKKKIPDFSLNVEQFSLTMLRDYCSD